MKRNQSQSHEDLDSLRKYSFALRENNFNLIPDDSLEAFTHFLSLKFPDNERFDNFIIFLQMDSINQRKELNKKSLELFETFFELINYLESDLSLLGYLLPLIDGILFGDLF